MQNTLQQIFAFLSGFIYNGAMVALIFGTGVYLTFKTRFFQIWGIPYILKHTFFTLFRRDEQQKSEGISPFQAVSTALAGTMGVGNIAGVATALTLGGPGAVFWMWVSAFFGMITKYAEIYLAVKYRSKTADGWQGGPMYYMENGLGMRWLGGLFSLFIALGSFGIGNMTQVNAVSEAAMTAFTIPCWVSGIVVAVLVSLVVFGGIKRIGAVTEFVIPFISVAYIACSVSLLVHNSDYLGSAASLIFREAFALKGVVGGGFGYGILLAMRYGVSRGVFTNEAGMGSAPIAHAAANCKNPARQSVWGIFEVFLDTIVVCTLTALVLLTADGGTLWQGGLDGVSMTSAAFASVFGRAGHGFIAVSVAFFAVAGMLGWCYYGETAIGYLTNSNHIAVTCYRFLFLACIFVGAISNLRLIWGLSDILNALMAIPNIIAILLLRREIVTPAKERDKMKWQKLAKGNLPDRSRGG